ncbi:hypothetical protein AB0I60_26700 [Actinosynnema sp. NPDC050436]|uniref:hypothetical protein n=1 Tax=Actinosynnema sp. NPDC050436 TaxID=3155659 RepID=UPI0033E377F4
MAETDVHDRKQAPPSEVGTKRREFAEDIAAMGNTRGGLTVHEVRGENERAVGLKGVLNGEWAGRPYGHPPTGVGGHWSTAC